jgi:hypothetical protein
MINGTKKERGPLLLSVLFVSLGIILLLLLWIVTLWFTRQLGSDPANTVGDVVLVSVLVMPILIYAIVSGSLKELRGLGGWGATFGSAITEPVSDRLAHVRVAIDDEDRLVDSSGETHPLRDETELGHEEHRPIFMKVTHGKRDYTLKALRDSVESYYRFRSFELVVFLTSDEQFVAYMPAWAAKQILNDPERNEVFVDAINGGRAELLSYPGVVGKAISTGATSVEALREMVDHNSHFLVVTDEKNQVAGVVEREQVIGRMILALIDSGLQRR